jgi:hypothetical protein
MLPIRSAEEEMKSILAFDPGGTTGFAFIGYTDDTEAVIFESGQIPNGHRGFIEWWNDRVVYLPETVIVCESFTLREGVRGVNLEPCYVMGALEALYNDKIFYQSPSYKSFCDNDALKELGFYVRGQQHARDAFRHAVAYLRTQERHKPTLLKGWPDRDLVE